MTKKKLKWMKAFILFTFALLILVVSSEIIHFTNKAREKAAAESNYQSTKPIDTTEPLPSETAESLSNTNAGSQPQGSEINADINNSEETKSMVTDDSAKTAMVFAGDIFMSEFISKQYDSNGVNGVVSDDLLKEFIQSDLAMANEEFPFSTRGKPMEDKQYTFRINPRYTRLFQDMQLDIVTLANNHVLDYGEEALLDTFTALDNAKIKYVGAGKNISEAKAAKTFQLNNKNIAILSASRVIPVATWNAGNSKPGLLTTYDPSILIAEINKAKKTSDYIIVYVHWGIEKHTNPEEYQRKLAKQYIDAGADLVVGSHPHVLQGIEYYKDKPIIYSLGNFMFYNTINQTALLKVTVNESNETQLQLLPCKAINGQTDIVNNTVEKADFYKYLTSISYDITFDKDGIISH